MSIEDELSFQIALQMQEEEKKRERHRLRQEKYLEQMMMQVHNPQLEEQIAIERAIEESKRDAQNPNPDTMTYEQLLELSEKLGHVNKGFTEEEIKKIPTKRIMMNAISKEA